MSRRIGNLLRSGGHTKPAAHAHGPSCSHKGAEVRVGEYTIMAGGTQYLLPEDLRKADLLVPLTANVPWGFGSIYSVLAAPMVDYGGVPSYWREFLEYVISDHLAKGKKLLVFCVGSHGRTGCFLASLIALLESDEETPDPIAAARERHCNRAVETRAQAEAVFALRNRSLPRRYQVEFAPKPQKAQAYPSNTPQP